MGRSTLQLILGMLAVMIICTSSFGQLQNSTMGSQHIIMVGAQVYDGIKIQFELEQVPIADRIANLPAFKLYVVAQVRRSMNHSFLSQDHQDECQASATSMTKMSPKNELQGMVESCIIFSNQVRPIYQFIFTEY